MGNLKVIMMGGRRCGKTSALASMFHQMNKSRELMKLLNVSDQTKLETKINAYGKEERQESLNNKITELVDFFKRSRNSEFLINKGPTYNYWYYKMEITLPGTKKSMSMSFRDSAGEFFDFGAHTPETEEYIENCDVYVVVVDTPYLMYENDAVSEAANIPGSINSFMAKIDEKNKDSETMKAKCVLFVPIKCEKWLHEGTISKVVEEVKEKFCATISLLSNRPNTEVAIIPIETAGDIEFSQMREAYNLTNENGKKIRITDDKGVTKEYEKIGCSMITKRTVLLQDGMMYSLKEGDIILEDAESYFLFGSKKNEERTIPRPVSWFKFPDDIQAGYTPTYKPKNCEQVSLHILRFMLNKARNEQSRNGFIQWLKNAFGSITIDDLNNTMVELINRGLIKDDVDGITRLKKYF